MSQLKGGTLKKGRITAVAETEAANKSCASPSLTVGANCSMQTMLHLHTDTVTGVACIRKWNVCDLIHLLCLHTLVTWVLVMPSGSHRTVLFNIICYLSTHLESTNPECTTKDFIFMKYKLEAGSDKLWKSEKLSCEKPYTLDCVFCVGWGLNESVGAFFCMVTEFVFSISSIFCSLLIITGIILLWGGITNGNETIITMWMLRIRMLI